MKAPGTANSATRLPAKYSPLVVGWGPSALRSSAARRAGGRRLGWSCGISFEAVRLKPLQPRWAAPQALPAAALRLIVDAWTSRVSCPASCCWRCREWPIRVSSARSSRCASTTRMAPSASASGTSAPGSASAAAAAARHRSGRGARLRRASWRAGRAGPGLRAPFDRLGRAGHAPGQRPERDDLRDDRHDRRAEGDRRRAGARRSGSPRSAMPAGARASSTRK